MLFSKTKSLRTILKPYIISSSRSKPLKSINECKDLPISNHLGINILIITSDGNLLLSERSSTVAVEQKRIGHTIAGSLDWKTLINLVNKGQDTIDLLDMIPQEILEEEEISLPEPGKYKIYPIALTRNLRYLSKPDFQLIGIVNATTKEILEKTKTGHKHESIKVIKIPLSMHIDFNNTDKCTLLKLITEKIAKPILANKPITGTYIALKKGKVAEKGHIKITYNKLSSNLILGLYAYIKAYEKLCKEQPQQTQHH